MGYLLVVVALACAAFIHSFFLTLNAIDVKIYHIATVAIAAAAACRAAVGGQLIVRPKGGIYFDAFAAAFVALLLISAPFADYGEEHLMSSAFLVVVIFFSRSLVNIAMLRTELAAEMSFGIGVVLASGILLFLLALWSIGPLGILEQWGTAGTRSEMANTVAAAVFFDGTFFRYNGYHLDPNYWGMYCLFAIFFIEIISSRIRYVPRWSRATTIIAVISLLMTQSRGCLAALVVYIIVKFIIGFLTKTNQVQPRCVMAAAGLMFCCTIAACAILSGDGAEIARERLLLSDAEESRTSVWIDYLAMSHRNDWSGIGLDRLLAERVGLTKSTHNSLIFLLMTLGLAGLIALVIFLFFIAFRAVVNLRSRSLPVRREMRVLLSAIMSFVVAIQFIDVIFLIPFWGCLALFAAASVPSSPKVSIQ